MYNTYWIISILSNLHLVKDFLKMDQGWASIHRKKDLFPLKPPLVKPFNKNLKKKKEVYQTYSQKISSKERTKCWLIVLNLLRVAKFRKLFFIWSHLQTNARNYCPFRPEYVQNIFSRSLKKTSFQRKLRQTECLW